jgi:hypothetical protein
VACLGITITLDHAVFGARPRVADLMTPELSAFNDRSVAAEQTGDAEEALAYHLGIPMFRGSRHRGVLEQLVSATGELMPWVWARWIVYQSLRAEVLGSRTGTQLRGALIDAVDTFHGDLMQAAYDEGNDPARVTARVMGESWVFHQLAIDEYDVLATFLDELAMGVLAAHAELARSWVGAPWVATGSRDACRAPAPSGFAISPTAECTRCSTSVRSRSRARTGRSSGAWSRAVRRRS